MAAVILINHVQDLARLVPTLAHSRRLSKPRIVNESVRYFSQQRSMCIAAAHDMQELLAENVRLVSELNALQSQAGGERIPVEARPVTEAMRQLMHVEQETLGEISADSDGLWKGRPAITPPSNGDEAPAGGPETSSPLGDSTHEGETRSMTQWDENYRESSASPENMGQIPEQQSFAQWDLFSSMDSEPYTLAAYNPSMLTSGNIEQRICAVETTSACFSQSLEATAVENFSGISNGLSDFSADGLDLPYNMQYPLFDWGDIP